MKNRGKLRRIVVDGRRYLWNYYYDDMDFANYPYSYYLFVPEENQRLKVRVYFTKYEPQMNLDIYTAGKGERSSFLEKDGWTKEKRYFAQALRGL